MPGKDKKYDGKKVTSAGKHGIDVSWNSISITPYHKKLIAQIVRAQVSRLFEYYMFDFLGYLSIHYHKCYHYHPSHDSWTNDSTRGLSSLQRDDGKINMYIW